MSNTLELTKALIACPSITPNDQGCQTIIANSLSSCGFECETLQFGEVTNLWATLGDSGPLFVFAGHTDVVPPGDVNDWQSPPFEPTVKNGNLYGRGVVDMKAAIAAMITAIETFLQSTPLLTFRIGFLITSDEEDGSSGEGTKAVMQTLTDRGIKIDYCLIGEPTSESYCVDMIKNGRRGSLSARLTIKGMQGHIAYPHKANNPIPIACQVCTELNAITWDRGNDYFDATQFQISNIHAGTGVGNVIPSQVNIDFNFRFSTEVTAEILKQRCEAMIESSGAEYEIDWHLSGEPFLTRPDKLIDVTQAAIKQVTGNEARLSTTGGTSDGRFIAPYGVQIIECGLQNETAHKVDESASCEDIETLMQVYLAVLAQLGQSASAG